MAFLGLFLQLAQRFPLPVGRILLLAPILLYVFWSVKSWHRLRHIPGPAWNSLSSLWLVRSFARGTFYTDVYALSEKHGDLVRVGPNELYSTDVDVLRRISASKSRYTRGGWYRAFRFVPTEDNAFSTLDEAAHLDARTRLGPAYSNVKAIEEHIDSQIQRLVDLIDRRFLSTNAEFRPVDFAKISLHFGLDVVGDVNFGSPFGFLDEGEDVFGYIKWFEGFFRMAMVISTFPSLVKAMQTSPLARLLPKDTDERGIGRLTRQARELADKRYASEYRTDATKLPTDMVSQFKAQGITKERSVNEVLLQIVAGSDSVATIIRMTLLHLINTPTAMAKLRSELDEATTNGLISSPISYAEARSLPYLQAVLHEGVRIFPAVNAPFYKRVPAGGDTISGYHVPEGTLIGHNIFGIMRSRRYWGADAHLFRPERWLEADVLRLEEMTAALEAPFGFGRYKCLGRNIAMMELNKVVPELLREYDFAVINAPSPLTVVNSGFFMMSDFWMRITARARPTE